MEITLSGSETSSKAGKPSNTSQSRSKKASDPVSASTTDAKELMAYYSFENNLNDLTDNLMHCSHYGNATYTTGKNGDKALRLNGTTGFVQLPTSIAHRNEMTISLWLKWNSDKQWERIFDFGNGEQQYMFLTTKAENGMLRLAAKNNNGEEQRLDICQLDTYQWRHITITIDDNQIVAYINGEREAASTNMTIRTCDFNPIFNYIGRSQFSSDPMLKGDINDLSIYNYALSAQEVKDLYLGKSANVDNINTEVTIINTLYYTLDGVCHDVPQVGVNIVRTQYSDGSTTVEKIIRK